MQNLREAAQQALEALEKHGHAYFKHEEQYNKAIMALHFALCDSLEPVTTCHELSKEGDKLSLPFNHFPDAGKMVATGQESRQVEPVAWRFYDGKIWCYVNHISDLSASTKFEPLYTAPPKREPLTDEEIAVTAAACNSLESEFLVDFARAIERAHGIGGEE